jgi:hypothetical protein
MDFDVLTSNGGSVCDVVRLIDVALLHVRAKGTELTALAANKMF